MHDDIPRTLVAGDGAFSLFSRMGVLSATVAPGTMIDTSAADGYRVPDNQWVKFTFVHDGWAARLLADEQEVRADEVTGPVPAVGPGGVCIGNRPGANESIRGDIDEVKIWRRDPAKMWHDFAERPVDQKSADCWADFLQRLDELLRAHPDCAARLLTHCRNVLEGFIHAVGARGPAVRARAGALAERYRTLWGQGSIDGVAMGELIAEWVGWTRSLGLEPAADADLQALVGDPCFRLLVEASSTLECDKSFTGYLRLWAQHFEIPNA
jgi:hypothetical protein